MVTKKALPVYPERFAANVNASSVLQFSKSSAVKELNLRCMVVSFYGGYFRAAWALFTYGAHSCYLDWAARVWVFWQVKVRHRNLDDVIDEELRYKEDE